MRKANEMKWKLMIRLVLLALFMGELAPVAQAFYNPSTGRWLSRDPIGEAGGANLYAFARNDGVNYIDLLGEAVFIDKDKKACKVKVSVRIYVSTKDPSNVNLSAIVPRIKNSIESQWNAGKWVLDGWTITFDATVGTKPPTRSPKGGGAPPPGDEIEITNDPPGESNATVGGIGRGVWSQNEADWTFAHEAGHLMGLPDDYTAQTDPKTGKRTGSTPNPGHGGHMMAEHGGSVVEHEVRDIVGKLTPCSCAKRTTK